jgi:DNA-binding GntR family transcriptional regulator
VVDLSPNKGARVAQWTDHDVDEIFGLRVQLEGHSARLAAQRITPQQLAQLEEIAAAMEREVAGADPQRLEKITDLNNRFHQGVHAAGGNRRLVSVVAAVVQRSLVEKTFRHYEPHGLARSCAHHREILAALSAHDADWAESVMRTHIYAGRHVAKGAVV